MQTIKFLLALFFVLIIQTSFSQKSDNFLLESLSMHSSILGQDIKYSVYLPKEYYTHKHNYPVVYLLHGYGDDETSWIEYGRIGQIADKAIENKEIVPMIFVMPQGFTSYYVNDYANTFRYQDMFIKELIPFIDSTYHTIKDKNHRATMGYSMGGFGALILPVKNPDMFGISVPLSISLRTDEQYMTEESPGWESQWGKLFGGEGKSGQTRITEYYKQYSPFHIFSNNDLSQLASLKLFIDNGDDEYTLCRSNEELHMLLRERNFSHEFRVRNGGHEFSFWRDALSNGLRFISDSFEGKTYSGDLKEVDTSDKKQTQKLLKVNNNQSTALVYLPEEYEKTTRKYPSLIIFGDFHDKEKELLAGQIQQLINNAALPPMIATFINTSDSLHFDDLVTSVETNYRIRNGFRFKAILGYNKGGNLALNQSFIKEKYAACVLLNASFDIATVETKLNDANKQSLKRTWFYIAAADKGMYYNENGALHINFREADIYHEYRVLEGVGDYDWLEVPFTESLFFIAKKFHN